MSLVNGCCFRINYFNQESRNTSGVSKSERLNSSDRSRLQDKVNLPKIFEFEEGINIQREDKSTAENLKPNEDVRLLQDETQEPNWALFSCFKTVDKKHHSSTHSKTSNVNIRRKDILRTPSDKACYNDHKCSLQIRADTTVLQRNESSLVGQATNEMEVEKYNSISETRLNPCNYHLPSNTRNSNILPANNNQKYVFVYLFFYCIFKFL